MKRLICITIVSLFIMGCEGATTYRILDSAIDHVCPHGYKVDIVNGEFDCKKHNGKKDSVDIDTIYIDTLGVE